MERRRRISCSTIRKWPRCTFVHPHVHPHLFSATHQPALTQPSQEMGVLAPLTKLSLQSCFGLCNKGYEMTSTNTREVGKLCTLLPTPLTLMQQPAQPVRLAAHTHASYAVSQVAKAHAVPGRLHSHNHVLVHTSSGDRLSGQVQLYCQLRTLLTLPPPCPELYP